MEEQSTPILKKSKMLFEGTTTAPSLKNFQKLSTLGSGSYARVYKIKSLKTQKKYALKEILKNPIIENGLESYIRSEIEIMQKIHSKNIIKLYTYFEDTENIYLILDYASKGQLYRIMQTTKTTKKQKIKVT